MSSRGAVFTAAFCRAGAPRHRPDRAPATQPLQDRGWPMRAGYERCRDCCPCRAHAAQTRQRTRQGTDRYRFAAGNRFVAFVQQGEPHVNHRPRRPLRQGHRSLQARALGARARCHSRSPVRLQQDVPARRPVARRRARLHEPGRQAPAQPGPGPHLRLHVRPGRALHLLEGDRPQQGACVRRPGGARGAGAHDRRGDQAPGAVSPPRADDDRRHAERLCADGRGERRRAGGARQARVGGTGADPGHRAVLAGPLPGQHRAPRRSVGPVEGRVPVPRPRGVAARHPRRARVRRARTRGSAAPSAMPRSTT